MPPASDDVLAQPTRARLFRALGELGRSATTEELASLVGLHVNGVRRQLARLERAGLVERTVVRGRRGRPRDEWSVSSRGMPGGQPPSGYRDLSRWLVRAMPAGAARLRQVERAGREIGRELAPEEPDGTASEFGRVLASLGFQPELAVAADGSARCLLCNCPYRDSARENADVVCTLHRGITAGLLERLSPGARLAAFEPRDPDLAGCVVEIQGTSWQDDGEGGGS